MMIPERKLQVQIKGVKDGLLITLGDGEWPELQHALMEHVRERSTFFQGAKVALDVGNQILHAAEMGNLRDQLSENGMSLWAVLSNSPLTEQTSQMLGLATRLSKPKVEQVVKHPQGIPEGEAAVFIHRTVRSGVKVEYQGHIIVVGDVNPGSEIIASGSVVVWGRLRGVVHAGAEGNEKAVVCALDMTPTQLRIARNVAVPPKRKGKPQPEIAHIVNGQVVADPWEVREGGL